MANRNRWILLLGAAALGAAASLPESSPETEVHNINLQATRSHMQGDLGRAYSLYHRGSAACAAAPRGDLLECARLWNNLGSLDYQAGRYREAQVSLEKALAVWQGGVAPRDRASALGNLAATCRALGRLPEAGRMYEEALRIRTEVLGADHPSILVILDGMAMLAYERGDYVKGEALARGELAAACRAEGEESVSAARARTALAANLRGLARLEESTPLYEQVLTTRERILGADHVLVGETLNGLGLDYRLQNRVDDAERVYLRALAIFRAAGLRLQESATLNNLAQLASRRPGHDAERLYEQAIALADQGGASDSPATAAMLSNYAAVLLAHRDWAKAQAVALRALAIDRRNAVGDRRIAVDLGRTAIAAHGLRHYGESAAMLVESLAMLQREPGGDPSEIGLFSAALADIRVREKRFAEAAELYAVAIRNLQAEWGANDRRLIPLLQGHVQALRALGEFAEAAKVDLHVTRIQYGFAPRQGA